MKFSDMRMKEVINEKSCRVLGNICDIIFEEDGCIRAIIVPGPAKYCGVFLRDSEFIIPFCNIKCIGEDIVLVCVDEKECLKKCSSKDKFKDAFF